ncbi:MAG: hypothetical protein AAF438_21990, partial [Pseudomonadota bacterium]
MKIMLKSGFPIKLAGLAPKVPKNLHNSTLSGKNCLNFAKHKRMLKILKYILQTAWHCTNVMVTVYVKKKQDSKTRYCRVRFGKEDPVTKKTNGKEIHPFDAWIANSSHTRYEGPRDHPRLVQYVKTALLSWLANVDVQAIIDDDLISLQKYIVAYACKCSASTEELIAIYRNLLDSANANASVKNVVHRLLLKLVVMVDVPAAAAD